MYAFLFLRSWFSYEYNKEVYEMKWKLNVKNIYFLTHFRYAQNNKIDNFQQFLILMLSIKVHMYW